MRLKRSSSVPFARDGGPSYGTYSSFAGVGAADETLMQSFSAGRCAPAFQLSLVQRRKFCASDLRAAACPARVRRPGSGLLTGWGGLGLVAPGMGGPRGGGGEGGLMPPTATRHATGGGGSVGMAPGGILL